MQGSDLIFVIMREDDEYPSIGITTKEGWNGNRGNLAYDSKTNREVRDFLKTLSPNFQEIMESTYEFYVDENSDLEAAKKLLLDAGAVEGQFGIKVKI